MNFVYVLIQIVLCCFLLGCNSKFVVRESKYTYYTREDWNATPATDTPPLKTPVPYLIIHHTYIPGACFDTPTCMGYMRGMQNYHMGLGWGDIGYNFCVGSEGGVYEGRGWKVVGIHAGRANNISIGICVIGDWRTERPPKIQLDSTKELIANGKASGVLTPDFKLIGHNQAMMTECPGTALAKEISTWDNFYPGSYPN